MQPSSPPPSVEEAEQMLASAAAEHAAIRVSADQARDHLYDVIRQVAPLLPQVQIVKATGWTREHVRKIVASGRPEA